MNRISIFFMTMLFFPALTAQVLPREGSLLNYRLIGFSFPTRQNTVNYTLRIAVGKYFSQDSFNRNTIDTISTDIDKLIEKVPSFGCQYTWQVAYRSNSGKTTSSDLYHFGTGTSKEIDSNYFRVRITKPTGEFLNDYVFLDNTRALYDMNGEPIWYIPDNTGLATQQPVPPPTPGITMEMPSGLGPQLAMDLKVSPQGTITFLFNASAYEINYAGEILWKAPCGVAGIGERNRFAHHEFSRLANGNYMILYNDNNFAVRNWSSDKESKILADSGELQRSAYPDKYQKISFNTIIEYDGSGQIVWSWKSSNYFLESDLRFRKTIENLVNYDMHENSFFFDESDNVVYLSMKGCSRVVKIEYPSGKVLNTYGEIFKPGVPAKKNGMFYGQHSCKRSADGHLYLFNNNVLRDSTALPEVVIMQEPRSKKDTLKKIWSYNFELDNVQKQNRASFASGGNVMELPGDKFFIYLPGPSGEFLIVNKEKKKLWSAISERFQQNSNKWETSGGYRASICTYKDLERLIWGSESLMQVPKLKVDHYRVVSSE